MAEEVQVQRDSQYRDASYSSVSLFVKNLTPEVGVDTLFIKFNHFSISLQVTEDILFEIFSIPGPVQSIRICRDKTTQESLGSGYVNYDRHEDAERALHNLNYEMLNGRKMVIQWKERDPSRRKAGRGNIHIKNLDLSIEERELHDTLSDLGEILSCKIARDDNGVSKGYAYVHFQDQKAAKEAIKILNGRILGNKEVISE